MVDFRILIVEHDESLRISMDDALKSSFKIQTASRGDEALRLMPAFHPDAVFIDFHIQDMTSVELQQEVNKRYPQVHTVMMSNVDRSKISVQSMRKRAMDYLYRSDDPTRFLADVCKLVRYLIDIKYKVPKEQALVSSGFYGLAKKLYEGKKWTVAEIEKILSERA